MVILAALLIFGVAFWVMSTREQPQADASKVVVRTDRPKPRQNRSRVIDE